VDIAGYADLLELIRNETGVSPESYNISLAANLHTTGQTAYGKINETFSPALKGTIKGNILTWDKEVTASQSGGIKTTALVDNPAGYLGMSRGAAGVLLILFLLVTAGLAIFSGLLVWRYHPVRTDPEEKLIRQIRKKYGQRIIETGGDGSPAVGNTIKIDNIDDLFKAADELGKPVLLANSNGHGVFSVLDGNARYQYITG
jgi:hypothetical protein